MYLNRESSFALRTGERFLSSVREGVDPKRGRASKSFS